MEEGSEKPYYNIEAKYGVPMLIKCIHLYFEKQLNSHMAEYELTAAQNDILWFIRFNEESEVNPIDIEKKFMLSRPTITGLLKRLESKDFIYFSQSCKDRRYKQVRLTEKGKEYSKTARERLSYMIDVLCGGFDDDQLEKLRDSLDRMLDNLKGGEV